MTQSPNLLIDHIAASQAQKEVTANAGFDALDQALCGLLAKALVDADATLTATEALTAMYLRVTGTLTAARTITVPANRKPLMVENATTGGFAVTIKTPSGAGVTINAGLRKILYCDGTDMVLVSEANVNAPYDVGGSLSGQPAAGATVLRYLGDCRVDSLKPVGVGTYAEFTPQGAASNWDCVDEVPYDVDATYNATNVTGKRDSFDCSNLAAITGAISGVMLSIMARKDDAGSRSLRSLTRVGGADYEGATIPVGTDYRYALQVVEQNPNTSTAWTDTTINGAEFGYKLQA